MKTITISGVSLLASLVMFLFLSCEKEIKRENQQAPVEAISTERNPMAETQLLKDVRQATARYNSTQLAINAGYVPTEHCVSSPAGGMGYHWANTGLVDPMFNPLEPEVLLYARGPGGNLRLVAVEYVVIDIGQPHPSFDGHLFDVGGAPVPVAHWTLHVWIHEVNPSGLFTPFNPNITCP